VFAHCRYRAWLPILGLVVLAFASLPTRCQSAGAGTRVSSASAVTNLPSNASDSNAPSAPSRISDSGLQASYPRPIRNVLETQIALDRLSFSPGSIDGVPGAQTRSALIAFQTSQNLPATGELDEATRATLSLDRPPLALFIITSNDLARLQPLSSTWLGKSEQSALEFETALELAAENCHANPRLLVRLNPKILWTNIVPDTTYLGPDVTNRPPATKASALTISLSRRTLTVLDAETNIIAHFPCSIAQRMDKRPVGELHVSKTAQNPNYTFNPEVFPESAEARQINTKLILPPGPNNPVGVAWISLDLEGYGIHGTPSPEQVGRTESHGCFRLANWNAARLVNLVSIGMPVRVEP
jgi:lipoprotein-anchoring transpeptidase ErfK/SrfK